MYASAYPMCRQTPVIITLIVTASFFYFSFFVSFVLPLLQNRQHLSKLQWCNIYCLITGDTLQPTSAESTQGSELQYGKNVCLFSSMVSSDGVQII